MGPRMREDTEVGMGLDPPAPLRCAQDKIVEDVQVRGMRGLGEAPPSKPSPIVEGRVKRGRGVGRALHRNPEYDTGNMLAFNDIGEVRSQVTWSASTPTADPHLATSSSVSLSSTSELVEEEQPAANQTRKVTAATIDTIEKTTPTRHPRTYSQILAIIRSPFICLWSTKRVAQERKEPTHHR